MKTKPTAAQLWIALARCHRAVEAVVEGSIRRLGLGVSDFMVLEALLHKGALTVTEIQAKVLLASGSMTAAADRLEKRALVRRKAVEGDRRARRLELTPEGRAIVEKVLREHLADLDRLMLGLDGDERKTLFEALRKLGQIAIEAPAAKRFDTKKETQ